MNAENSTRIILIDDNAEVLDRLSKAVEQLGYDCCAVSDSKAAVEMIKKKPFDIVVTDINMPGLSGTQVIKVARASHPESRIIAVSGNMDAHVKRNALKYGADVFMSKPLDLFQFLKEISGGKSGSQKGQDPPQ